MNANKNDIIVITGASAGVGRATVREFAKRGCKIGLIARNNDRLEKAKIEVEALGGQALVLPTDVVDFDAIDHAAEIVENEFGPIDVWVNVAMTTIFGRFQEIKPEEYKRVTDVCYLGFVYGTMAAIKRMRPRNRGAIVQVGSVLAYRGIPLQTAYCGAKHAIQGFNESLRSELMHDNINVHLTMVQMPALNTPQFSWCLAKLPKNPQPVPPIYQPEVAARAIVWAAYHERREITVGLTSFIIEWGNKIFPGLGDRYLAKTGISGQMTQQDIDPNRPCNLWDTVDGDYAVHGDFDDQAKESDWVYKVLAHRDYAWTIIILVMIIIIVGLIVFF